MAGLSDNDIKAAMKSLGYGEDILDEIVTDKIDIDIEIPSIVSIESTLKEITQLASVLYLQLKSNPNNPVTVMKLIQLLEIKLRITGLNKLTPDVQNFIDSEVNVYKRKFLEVAYKLVPKECMEKVCQELTNQGL